MKRKSILSMVLFCIALASWAQVRMTSQVTLSQTKYKQFTTDTAQLKSAVIIMLYKTKADSAILFANKLIEIAPTAQNFLLLSAAQVVNNDCMNAVINARRAFAIDSSTFYLNALAFRYKECALGQPAIVLFRKSIQRNPNQQDVREFLIELELQNGRQDSIHAISEIQKQIQQDTTGRYAMRLASIYLQQNKTSDAINQLDGVMKVNPKEKTAPVLKASLYMQDGNIDSALNALNHYLNFYSNNDTIFYYKAQLLAQRSDTLKAIETFDKAIRINPREVLYYDGIIALLQSMGKVPEQILYALQAKQNGLEAFNIYITNYEEAQNYIKNISPTSQSKNGNKLALAYLNLGQYANAVVEAKNQLEVNKSDTTSLYVLGYAHMMVKDYANAEKSIDELLMLTKQRSDIQFIKADILFRQNKLNAAIAQAESGLKSNPASSYRNILLGMYYKRSKEEFAKHFKTLN